MSLSVLPLGKRVAYVPETDHAGAITALTVVHEGEPCVHVEFSQPIPPDGIFIATAILGDGPLRLDVPAWEILRVACRDPDTGMCGVVYVRLNSSPVGTLSTIPSIVSILGHVRSQYRQES